MLKVIKATDYRRMPWKNGQGETIEIAVSPDNANWNNFEWRVSMAQITQSGPFSVFPDVDRTLLVLSGGQIKLSTGSRKSTLLMPGSEPYSFAGEEETKAILTGDSVIDLNVMTHRQRFTHEMKRVHLQGKESLIGQKNRWHMIVVVNGSLSVEWEDRLTRVGPMDSLLSDQAMNLTAVQATDLVLITLQSIMDVTAGPSVNP
jgi:uncharacterized protein